MSPLVLFSGDLSGLAATPGFRASLAVSLLCFGLIVLMLAWPYTHLVDIPARLLRAPAYLKWSLALTAWLLVSGLSSGLTPHVPALGSPDRFDGTFIQAAWFGTIGVSAGLTAARAMAPSLLMRLAIVGAVATALWSLLQATGHDPLTTISPAAIEFTYPAGAFGHGALASMYLAFIFLLWVGWRYFTGNYQPIDLLISVILAIGLGATAGRAAFFSLAVVFSLLFVLSVLRSGTGKLYLLANAMVVILVISGSTLLLPRAQTQMASTMAAFQGQDPSFNYRIPAWRTGLRVAAAHPLFGVGPGGFPFAAWDYASPEDATALIEGVLRNRFGVRDWSTTNFTISGNVLVFFDENSGQQVATTLDWDKAHNYVLDLALTAGIPAAVLFVLFCWTALVALWRSGSAFSQASALGMLAFLIFGLVWFGTIGLDPTVWALVGAGLGFTAASPGGPGRTRAARTDGHLEGVADA